MIFTFDGTMDQTIDAFDPDEDTLVISVAPVNFEQVQNDESGNAVFRTVDGNTLTVNDTPLEELQGSTILTGGGSLVVGGQGDDSDDGNTVSGTANGDIIVGMNGSDIVAGDGDNLIFGGNGRGDANDDGDDITAGSGNDKIFGNAGDDDIDAGAGDAIIFGGIGGDDISAQPGEGESVRIFGGGTDATDTITVDGDGDSTIFGGDSLGNPNDGADNLNVTGTGDHSVFGNGGADTISVDGENGDGNLTVRGGFGADDIDVSNTAGDNLIVGGTNRNPGESSDANSDRETISVTGVTGGSTSVFGGNGRANSADGGDDITFEASSGSHSVFGNGGDDTFDVDLSGDATADVFSGVGETSFEDSSFDVSGEATLNLRVNGNDSTLNTLNVEDGATANVTSNGGNNSFNASGSDGTVNFTTGAGDDLLISGAGDDTLAGGAGDNVYSGGAGTNTFDFSDNGGSGVDEVHYARNGGDEGSVPTDTVNNFDTDNDFVAFLDGTDENAGAVNFDADDTTDGPAGTKFGEDDVGSSYYEVDADNLNDGTDRSDSVIKVTNFDLSDDDNDDSEIDSFLGSGNANNSYIAVQNGSDIEIYFNDDDSSGFAQANLFSTLANTDIDDLSASNFGVYGAANVDIPVATDGNDEIVGTDGDDTISGLGGDDSIDGLAGNDTLNGDAAAGDPETIVETQRDGQGLTPEIQTVTLGGDFEAGDVVSIRDDLGNSESYTVQDGDTLSDVVNGLSAAAEQEPATDGNTNQSGLNPLGSAIIDNADMTDDSFTVTFAGLSGNVPELVVSVNGEDLVDSGNDVITGGAGDETIDGGLGDDVAVYAGNSEDYTIDRDTEDGTVTVTDNNTDDGLDEGTDTLTNIETIRFGDQDVSVNRAPTANDDTLEAVDEDSGDRDISFDTLLGNDTDADGDDLTITEVTNAVGGTVSVSNDGSNNVTFSLAEDFNGEASFDYTVSDGNGGTDTATATFDVNPVNDAPVATDDTLMAVDEDSGDRDIDFETLLDNDNDPDGDDLTITEVTNAVGGTVSVSNDGSNNVTFSLAEDFNGEASFDYTVSDGNGGTDTATVTFPVNPVNDAPVANDTLFATDEDTATLVDAFTDPDGDDLTVDSVDQDNTDGAVTINDDGTVSYDPSGAFDDLADGETGRDTFSYTVSDGNGGTTSADVTVLIDGVNDAPVAMDDQLDAVAEDSGDRTFAFADLTENDEDPDTPSEELTVTQVSNDVGGTATLTDSDADGVADQVTFTLDENFSGTASFDYTVSDGQGGTDTATASFEVTPVNDAPVVMGERLEAVDEDNVATYSAATLLANEEDPDGDDLTITEVSNATGGTATLSGDGQTIVFVAQDDFNGDASFDYTVSDGVNQATATATVPVTPVNDDPTAMADTETVSEDATNVAIDVLTNDTDIDNNAELNGGRPDGEADTLTVTAVSNDDGDAVNGTVSINEDGTGVIYTPGDYDELDVGDDAMDTFTYTVSDGNGGTDTAEVTVTVTGEGPVRLFSDGELQSSYATIQEAVDNASDGDTITAEAGDYDEDVTVDVANLTIEGANAGIAGSSDDRGDESNIGSVRFAGSATGSSFDGFSVNEGNPNNEGANVFVLASDVSVSNNQVVASDDSSIGVIGGRGASNLTIDGNSFANFDTSAAYFNPTVDGESSFVSNSVTGSPVGIYIDSFDDDGSLPVDTVENNMFSDIENGDVEFDLRGSETYDLEGIVGDNDFSPGDNVQVFYGGGADVTGSDANDSFFEFDGFGDVSAVTLDGAAGDDILRGTTNDDTLIGGAGADVFSGGVGSDALDFGTDDDNSADEAHYARNGGDEADSEVGVDTITGFQAGDDLEGDDDFIAFLDGAGDGDGSVDFAADDSNEGAAGTTFSDAENGDSSYYEVDADNIGNEDMSNAMIVFENIDLGDDGTDGSSLNEFLSGANADNSYFAIQNGEDVDIYFNDEDSNGFDEANQFATLEDVSVEDLGADNFGVYSDTGAV